jgi:hypothetical protein
MAIKHSKYRNTGILFELLVRQTTSDLLNNQDSKAVKILKKHFTNTELGKEYSLYSAFVTSPKLSEAKAEILISTILEQYKKLSHETLSKAKYNLIKEIKKTYNLEDFFKAKIENYKPYASVYTIFESQSSPNSDTKQIVLNKINLLEHITQEDIKDMQAPQSMVEELMHEDKEIRILTYKLLVEKFNKKYQGLSERQKGILKEYVASISDSANLRKFLNEKLKEIKQELIEQTEKVKDKVTKIKTQEVIKFIKPLKEGIAIKDETITGLLQYYELIDELKRVSK